jgi:metal-sulfur cluster biosynthetic enzyme
MPLSAPETDRYAQVWDRLDGVMDPELDESLPELGFIEEVIIADDGIVTIVFKLPTYWCSPNFAFLMADDIRSSVAALPWVKEVRPQLRDHMSSEEVNRGVRLGLTFDEAFPELETSNAIADLREKFQRKAFERRQEAVLLASRAVGYDADALCSMTLAELDGIEFGSDDAMRQKRRYRCLLMERGLAQCDEDLAFVQVDGKPIRAGNLPIYLRHLRGVRINMEFNSALCRGLLEARYKVSSEMPVCAKGCADSCSRSDVSPR